MRRLGAAIAVLTTLNSVIASPALRAQTTLPEEGAVFLGLPVGARAVAMGQAVTAVGDAEAPFWNPASMAGLAEGRVTVVRGDYAIGSATALAALAPVGSAGVVVGVSYVLLDIGDISETDFQGNPVGTLTFRDHQAALALAMPLGRSLSAGVRLKSVRLQRSCRGQCTALGENTTAHGMDAGLRLTLPGIRLGAEVANFGPRVAAGPDDDDDPLLAELRVGGAYDVVAALGGPGDVLGWVSLEARDRLAGRRAAALYLGSEIVAGGEDAISVRAGYVIRDPGQASGAGVGVGLRHGRFDIDVARSLASAGLASESEQTHVTLSLTF